MRILIAEDNPVSAMMLQNILEDESVTIVMAANGTTAWDILQEPEPPSIAILDWMMPGMNGVELCRRIRSGPSRLNRIYLIILSVMNGKEEIALGLEAGANDFITKPFSNLELKARVSVGMRIARLEKELAEHKRKARLTVGVHVAELEKKLTESSSALEKALVENKQLKQLLPVCAYCRKIRNDDEYWLQIKRYFSSHLDTQSAHGVCPECYAKLFDTVIKQMGNEEFAASTT